MTECDKVREILPAYLEGIALPAEAETVASHLATCQACSLEVQALIKSQRLIRNLPEVEPPPWLKTRIMARLEEGAEEEEESTWNFSRLRDLLLYPLKVKIPLQAVSVLLVAVAVFYVYKTIQPEMKPAQQGPQAIVPAPLEKERPAFKMQGSRKAVEQTVRDEQAQPPQKTDVEEGAKAAPDVNEPLAGASRQPSSPPELKITEGMKDEMRRAVLGPEPQKTKAAKAHAPGAVAPAEDRAHTEKTEAAKGTGVPITKPETLAVTIHVNDLTVGSKEVEALLRNLSASVARESKEGSNIISTEVPQQKAKEIVKRLTAIGQVQQKSPFSDAAADRPVSVRIQVFQKQP